MQKIINLGCGSRKKMNEFGVDIIKASNVDLIWDLNKELPKKYHEEFEEVYSHTYLEHCGNPLKFLKDAEKLLKHGGKIIIVTDNASYWRYHFKWYYHPDIWKEHDSNVVTQHKMLFQIGHIENLLLEAGYHIGSVEFYGKQDSFPDRFLPKKFGYSAIKAIAYKIEK